MRVGNFTLGPITLSVKDGEVALVFGPNGAGKSTLLKTIVGVYMPLAGSVVLDGVDVTSFPIESRGVGYVPQSYALFEHMDVRTNIEFGLKARGVPRADRDRIVKALAERLGLRDFLNRMPGELSGGMRQRVAVARALAVNPRALLLDEPLSNLDPETSEATLDIVSEMAKDMGLKVLMVSQGVARPLRIADRVYFMKSGRLIDLGTPTEAVKEPKVVDAALYMGFENVFDEYQMLRAMEDPSASPTLLRKGSHMAFRSTSANITEAPCNGLTLRGRVLKVYQSVDGILRALVDIGAGKPLRCLAGGAALSRGQAVRVCVDVNGVSWVTDWP